MHGYPKTQCQGLSMSFCFRDMAEGKVNPALVINVICGTNTTVGSLDSLIRSYRESYWRHCADEAERLVRQFWAEGRIYEPRAHGQEPPNLSNGHWITD